MKNKQLSFFDDVLDSPEKLTNVASVPQRSPFRYPGGKTWLVPTVRQWLRQADTPVAKLVEPFAGGGIIGLTAAFEGLSEKVIMSELDPDIAAVWQVMLSDGNEAFAERIYHFDLTAENVQQEFQRPQPDLSQQAFCTILKNRVLHGGIMAKGAGFIKSGENGKGLTSRWYPKTLRDRIKAIQHVKDKIGFYQKDAFELLAEHQNDATAYFFIDPPYTVAGKRLYTFYDIDHERLFAMTAQLKGRFMLTYDDTEEVRIWVNKYGLAYKTIPMKTTHHLQKNELLITDNLNW